MTRTIKAADISHISLVPHRKNHLPKFFEATGTLEFKSVVLNQEQETLTVIIFPPDDLYLWDCRFARNFWKRTAHDYLRKGARLDIVSSGRAINKNRAAVVESFFIQPGDPRFQNLRDYENESVDATGAWCVVIELYDAKLKRLYQRSMSWNGVTIFGEALFEQKDRRESCGTVRGACCPPDF